MSRTKKALIVLGIWLGVGLVVAIALIPSAQAHDEDHQEGAVAVCNWENFEQYGHDGYNWVWIRCNHTLHGHGNRYHPRAQLKREAREFPRLVRDRLMNSEQKIRVVLWAYIVALVAVAVLLVRR